MTSPGFQLDPDELGQARRSVQQLQERAAALIDLAADANPEWTIWGLVGAPFAVWYWQNAGQVYEHLQLMGEALASNVQALGDTHEAYTRAEQAIVDALKGIETELGDKGAPW